MTKADVFDVVKNNILDILGDIDPDKIQPEISMRDLGANSIDRADVLIQSLSDLKLKIPMVEFGGIGSIGELVDFLNEKLIAVEA